MYEGNLFGVVHLYSAGWDLLHYSYRSNEKKIKLYIKLLN